MVYLVVTYDTGDRLLQWGTIYDAHRMSGKTIYDDASGPGGPLVWGDQLTRYSPQYIVNISGLAKSTFTKQITVDSSMKKLSPRP